MVLSYVWSIDCLLFIYYVQYKQVYIYIYFNTYYMHKGKLAMSIVIQGMEKELEKGYISVFIFHSMVISISYSISLTNHP